MADTGGNNGTARQPLALLSICGQLVVLTAPMSGRLTISAGVNDIIEPGSIIGQIDPSSGFV